MQKRFFSKYISLSFDSLKDTKMILLSIFPFTFSFIIWAIFFVVSIIHFSWYIGQFPNIWVEYAYLQNGIFSNIAYYLLYFCAISTMILYGIVIFGVCNIIASCFISPFVVSFVKDKYYGYITLNAPNFIESLKLSSLIFIKTFAKFAILSILCYCLGFIGLGFIGVILSVFIYFRFFSVNLNYEIALNIMNKQECEIFFMQNRIPLFFLNIIIFIPLYIPILNFFVLVWQMLVLTHFMLEIYSKDAEIQAEVIES